MFKPSQTYSMEIWGYSEQNPVEVLALPIRVILTEKLSDPSPENVQKGLDDKANVIAYLASMYFLNLNDPDGLKYMSNLQKAVDRTTLNRIQAYAYGGVPKFAIRMISPDGRKTGKYASDHETFTRSFRDAPFVEMEDGRVRSLISL